MDRDVHGAGEWVLLTYWLPRVPSTPRSAVWRKLRRIGVAQMADGLVGLPADARTREQLEWVAANVVEAGGRAGVWLARPAGRAQERDLASQMAAARAAEYAALRDEAVEAQRLTEEEQARVLRRLRDELRRVRRRDFFPPVERDQAIAAVEGLAEALAVSETTMERS